MKSPLSQVTLKSLKNPRTTWLISHPISHPIFGARCSNAALPRLPFRLPILHRHLVRAFPATLLLHAQHPIALAVLLRKASSSCASDLVAGERTSHFFELREVGASWAAASNLRKRLASCSWISLSIVRTNFV